MDVQTLTIKPWGILAQGASANERWQWMREFQGTGVNAKMVFLGLVVALVLALLALLVYMMYKRFVEAKKWEQFNILSEQTGLRGEDLQLLTRAVKRAGLKGPAVVFSDADAYNTVATDFMFSPQVFSYPAKVQIGLQALLESMNVKLGFWSELVPRPPKFHSQLTMPSGPDVDRSAKLTGSPSAWGSGAQSNAATGARSSIVTSCCTMPVESSSSVTVSVTM